MYTSARTAANSSSNRLKSPISRSNSHSSEYDVEAGERTPLLLTKVKIETSDDSQVRQWQTVQTMALLGMLALILFLLLGIIIAVYLMLLEIPRPWPVSHPFYMVERHIWWPQSSAALEVPSLNKSAVQNIIVLHTRSEPCHDQPSCTQYVRKVQDDASTRSHMHIPYNFLIGGDGKTYEGRGWRAQHGFPDLPGKNDTIVVGIIGTYNNIRPDDVLYAETKALITESIRRFSLSPAYRVYGVVNGSLSKDDAADLYSELKQWRHWRGFVKV